MFDVQAHYVNDFILGRIVLPVEEERVQDVARWMQIEQSIMDNMTNVGDKQFRELMVFQSQYIDDLQSAIVNCRKIHLDGVLTIFHRFLDHREENMATHRHHQFTSTITGTLSLLNLQL